MSRKVKSAMIPHHRETYLLCSRIEINIKKNSTAPYQQYLCKKIKWLHVEKKFASKIRNTKRNVIF
jgi:hypothetical protein